MVQATVAQRTHEIRRANWRSGAQTGIHVCDWLSGNGNTGLTLFGVVLGTVGALLLTRTDEKGFPLSGGPPDGIRKTFRGRWCSSCLLGLRSSRVTIPGHGGPMRVDPVVGAAIRVGHGFPSRGNHNEGIFVGVRVRGDWRARLPGKREQGVQKDTLEDKSIYKRKFLRRRLSWAAGAARARFWL